ncbi:hypothetical protein C8F01DRAFT_743767 [Mycena amicta]|nr:hypothetical protein C8F01DRAFT_743767 [Mycena amicta]
MASINVTIQHSSPLIRYSGDWSQKDTIGGGFSWTESSGASATATFPAKWIQILGSRNKFHGAYTVSIDGKSYLRNGSTSDDQLTTPIFNETLVDSGEHTTIITNTEWMTLNIDSIKFTCDIGSLDGSTSSSRLETTTNNASDPAFAYFPHGTWSMQSGLHSTSEVNASVNYTFSVR